MQHPSTLCSSNLDIKGNISYGPQRVKKLKNHVNKNQRKEPIQQKYKANENTSRHYPKKKKTNNHQKLDKNIMQKRTHGYKMTINNNKEYLRQKGCHLPQIG